jgi:hypothetical protein
MPCSSCHKSGHNIRTCPKFNDHVNEAAELISEGAAQYLVCAALDVALPGLGQAVSFGLLIKKINDHDHERTKTSRARAARGVITDVAVEYAGV